MYLVCIYTLIYVCPLRKCLHIDVGEDDVMQDVDSVNLVDFPDAVSELEEWDVVHSHPERLMGAQDLHLKMSRTQIICDFHQEC